MNVCSSLSHLTRATIGSLTETKGCRARSRPRPVLSMTYFRHLGTCPSRVAAFSGLLSPIPPNVEDVRGLAVAVQLAPKAARVRVKSPRAAQRPKAPDISE